MSYKSSYISQFIFHIIPNVSVKQIHTNASAFLYHANTYKRVDTFCILSLNGLYQTANTIYIWFAQNIETLDDMTPRRKLFYLIYIRVDIYKVSTLIKVPMCKHHDRIRLLIPYSYICSKMHMHELNASIWMVGLVLGRFGHCFTIVYFSLTIIIFNLPILLISYSLCSSNLPIIVG